MKNFITVPRSYPVKPFWNCSLNCDGRLVKHKALRVVGMSVYICCNAVLYRQHGRCCMWHGGRVVGTGLNSWV